MTDSQIDAHPQQLATSEVKGLMDHVRQEFGKVLFIVTGGDPLKRSDPLY